MEHLKHFLTNTIITEYENSEDYNEPYISYVEEDSSVHYNYLLK